MLQLQRSLPSVRSATRFPRRGVRRRGVFLILVLVFIVVATMAVYSFTDLMLAYDESVHLTANRTQCVLAVESGAEATRLILAQPPASREEMGGVFDNPQIFRGINVVPGIAAADRVNYAILAPNLDERGQYAGIRFGLQNESAKLNVNALPALELSTGSISPMLAAIDTLSPDFDSDNLAVSLLMGLPGMTIDVAEAILDWLDEDDDPRPNGCEADYYMTLPTPYTPKNGPIDSIEELLLVRGVTPEMLFGVDSNRNGLVDAAEQQLGDVDPFGPLALGWVSFLTVYSMEANKRSDGSPRINVNQDDLEQLYEQLLDATGNDDWASFIVAYRIAGQPGATVGTAALSGALGNAGIDNVPETVGGLDEEVGLWTVDGLDEFDLSGGGGTNITQILDLINARVTVGEGGQQQRLASPFFDDPVSMATYLPTLMGSLTTSNFTTMPGRINLNQCPADLLRGIPLLDPDTIEDIIDARAQNSDTENRQFETWPLVEGLVTTDQMRLLLPLLTAGGDVYRAQIVGFYESGNLYSRAEVVIDATTVNPKITFMRDLSHLGRGFDVAVLGIFAADVMGADASPAGSPAPATSPSPALPPQ